MRKASHPVTLGDRRPALKLWPGTPRSGPGPDRPALVPGRGDSMSAESASVAVVLVHGGFVDGSGWQDVYRLLTKDGYSVSIAQNPTHSLDGDVAATRQVIDRQTDPVVLVGHSYGGVVITEAGMHPKVMGLTYIAAFAPDTGESVNTLIANSPPGAAVPP